MDTFIDLLIARSRAADPGADRELDDALIRLDMMLQALAADLRVEYFGPEVGLGAGAHVYRLVVREHLCQDGKQAWSVRVCTALSHAGWRAEWTLQGASRLRKRIIVARLPAFFAGYAQAVLAAGKERTNSGMRVVSLARRFALDQPPLPVDCIGGR
ncbi:MAG: hypothetical protein M0Z84_00695 [Gammaproteobacteria bacterium]|nr:hypothetical protein [Gammaproteobacteria bacterium]